MTGLPIQNGEEWKKKRRGERLEKYPRLNIPRDDVI